MHVSNEKHVRSEYNDTDVRLWRITCPSSYLLYSYWYACLNVRETAVHVCTLFWLGALAGGRQ